MEDKESKGEDLLSFVHNFTDSETMAIEEDLGHGYVRLKVTEAERRQALQDIRSVEDVVKELVRNARDAGANTIYITFQKEKGRWRNITVLDDGEGIPLSLHRKIFEARVTSKIRNMVEDRFGVHGRGMALFSIKQAAEHIELINSLSKSGSIIKVRIDTKRLPEKKDQSSFPRIEENENGEMIITGGAHNVPRVLTEFALHLDNTRIYLGSNAEILSTLYHHSIEMRKLWASGQEDDTRPLWFDLGRINEGKALHMLASNDLGLNVSERNAFRILEDEIQPLMSVNEILNMGESKIPVRRADLHVQPKSSWGDHLARRISKQDMKLISAKLEETLADIGEKYYLLVDKPAIKRRKDRLIISLGLHEKEED
jgi:anti-sigma regulatory factor (Ser/Thr protein kinase)